MLKIIGNGKSRKLNSCVPWWGEEEELYFTYKGNKYFLSEFFAVDHLVYRSEKLKEFDGVKNETYFSGILIKIGVSDFTVKVYSFYEGD